MPRLVAFGILVWLAATGVSFAQVSLPLGGYYRPGRCIPILVESSKQSIRVFAEGAIPVEIEPSNHNRVIPFLILSPSAQTLHVDQREIPLHALNENERLVAFDTRLDPSAASRLLPGRAVIPVLLASNAIDSFAWEAVDAMVIDEPLDAPRMWDVLANGTMLALRSGVRPPDRLPWRQAGDFFVLQCEFVGPESAIDETAYLPLQSWQPQQPAVLRRQIVLAAVLISLLMLSTLLIQKRARSIAAIVLVGLLSSVALAGWKVTQPQTHQPQGTIEVQKNGFVQQDTWRFIAAGSTGAKVELAGGWDRPVFLNSEHAALLNVRAQYRSDGAMFWFADLPPNARLAVLHRDVAAGLSLPRTSPTRNSHLYEMARQSYLARGLRIIGENHFEADPEDRSNDSWPTVEIGQE